MIKPRDTLFWLAKMYNTTVEDIEESNPEIDADNLRIGMKIVIHPNRMSKPVILTEAVMNPVNEIKAEPEFIPPIIEAEPEIIPPIIESEPEIIPPEIIPPVIESEPEISPPIIEIEQESEPIQSNIEKEPEITAQYQFYAYERGIEDNQTEQKLISNDYDPECDYSGDTYKLLDKYKPKY
ncbi:MAG: LysM domain-containing protein [Lachnospiraceae bacterium]|nr:LysM domain-containing protein [Lachnospiraceae bacterium]